MKNKSTEKPDESQCIKFDYIQERLRAKSFIPCMVSCHYHGTCDLNGANAVVLHAPYNYRFHQCFTFISQYFTLAFARTSLSLSLSLCVLSLHSAVAFVCASEVNDAQCEIFITSRAFSITSHKGCVAATKSVNICQSSCVHVGHATIGS